MKNSVLFAVCCGCLAALPVRAQSPTPNTAYPDSPARANPRARPGIRTPGTDDGKRGPRGPLDWERTEALSADGRWFVTANVDGRMRVWDVVSGKSEVELPAGVIDVVFSPDGRSVAARLEKPAGGMGGRSWQVFNVADGKPAGQPLVNSDAEDDGAEIVFFSPDGKGLAGFVGAGANIRVVLWDAAGGKPVAVQPVKELFGGGALAFSPDGKMLAAVGAGTGVTLLGVPDLKPLKAIPCTQKSLGTVAFSPDGKGLATGGDEQRTVRGRQDGYPTASIYEVATGKLVAELKITPNAGARVRQIVFADGGRAVVTATDGSAQAWSPVDGRLQVNLPGGGFPLAVSPDGKTLAGSQYPDLRCWDTAAWRLGLKIANAKAGYGTGTGSMGYVPLAFIPDGSGIVTLRGNGVAAWEIPGGRPVIEWDATQSRVIH